MSAVNTPLSSSSLVTPGIQHHRRLPVPLPQLDPNSLSSTGVGKTVSQALLALLQNTAGLCNFLTEDADRCDMWKAPLGGSLWPV